MTLVVRDPLLSESLITSRRELGLDHYDEVWEGVYLINSPPNDEHQYFVGELTFILESVLGEKGLADVRLGVNLSDHEVDWTKNYRVPDVAVFLKTGAAKNCGTHWLGAADFLVEVVSEYDQSRAKLPFYSELGVQELLLIERDPWVVELYQHRGGELQLAATSTAANPQLLSSTTVPLTFQLLPAEPRPLLQVQATQFERTWRI